MSNNTIGEMRQLIADDLARDDLSSQIAESISRAIEFYKEKRFWFNETESTTFTTVSGTSDYDVDDDADIPKFIEIDSVLCGDGETKWELQPTTPAEMKILLENDSTGRPFQFGYFAETFHLYPIPNAAYVIRPIGQIEIAEPSADAVDSDTTNVWANEAKELIRCRATAYVCLHTTHDAELGSMMTAAEQDAYQHLRRKTGKKQAIAASTIESTQF